MKIYFITWTIREYSGKTITGSDLISANDEAEAKQLILQKNSAKKIDTTNIKLYNFSELCKKYNITYSLPKLDSKKTEKPKTIEHKEETDDIF